MLTKSAELNRQVAKLAKRRKRIQREFSLGRSVFRPFLLCLFLATLGDLAVQFPVFSLVIRGSSPTTLESITSQDGYAESER